MKVLADSEGEYTKHIANCAGTSQVLFADYLPVHRRIHFFFVSMDSAKQRLEPQALKVARFVLSAVIAELRRGMARYEFSAGDARHSQARLGALGP
jgi:hypothetical protein